MRRVFVYVLRSDNFPQPGILDLLPVAVFHQGGFQRFPPIFPKQIERNATNNNTAIRFIRV